MQFRNPFFVENMMHDQPYCSLLLVSPFCDGSCPGCQNKGLTSETVIDIPLEKLIEEYTNNPFVDGITVAGLEICLSGDDFIFDLYKFISQANIKKVTIYSRYSPEYPKLKSILNTLGKISCVEELYCKTGPYCKNSNAKIVSLKSNNNDETWQISLASNNQDFLVLKSHDWTLSSAAA